ncbi:hypothetical protein [Pseudanabaena mucicola]|uniref:PEP-CTERM sorting domain-containing protein n=1 Tax=Pseudanabaena mucicola FACHB-723 TaxID=2692860 RepID=A0ABR7ZUX2_9CYAN|nr:hypothetical protein [Pseudanabaena mucicola]MBD2187592.1 hypothetical protein [Pseudanabaena mucicola FACHB-723]
MKVKINNNYVAIFVIALLGSVLSWEPIHAASLYFKSNPPPRQADADPILDIDPFASGQQVTFDVFLDLTGVNLGLGGDNVKINFEYAYNPLELKLVNKILDPKNLFEVDSPLKEKQKQEARKDGEKFTINIGRVLLGMARDEGGPIELNHPKNAPGGQLLLSSLIFVGVAPVNTGFYDFRLEEGFEIIDSNGVPRQKEFALGKLLPEDLLGEKLPDPNGLKEVEVQCPPKEKLSQSSTSEFCQIRPVPIPSSLMGTLAVAVFGVGTILKSKLKTFLL